jgi:hypothetical protein
VRIIARKAFFVSIISLKQRGNLQRCDHSLIQLPPFNNPNAPLAKSNFTPPFLTLRLQLLKRTSKPQKMKNLQIALAFILAVFSLPSIACGGYGTYRLQSMNAVELLAFNRVVTGTIVGIQIDPRNASRRVYTMQIEEQFKGRTTVGEIVVDGGNCWKLYDAKVGNKALLFTQMVDGKETLSN